MLAFVTFKKPTEEWEPLAQTGHHYHVVDTEDQKMISACGMLIWGDSPHVDSITSEPPKQLTACPACSNRIGKFAKARFDGKVPVFPRNNREESDEIDHEYFGMEVPGKGGLF